MRYLLVVFPLVILFLITVFSSVQAIWIDDGNPIVTAPRHQEYLSVLPDGEGGALMIWRDIRSGDREYFVQRIDPNGDIYWAVDGIKIEPQPHRWSSVYAAADGSGGGFLVFILDQEDITPGAESNNEIYAQRIDNNVQFQWPDFGVSVCSAPEDQMDPIIRASGDGGAFVAWGDLRNGRYLDIYAQKLDVQGNAMWDTDGIPICRAEASQTLPRIVADNDGGAYFSWIDFRHAKVDSEHVYLQHVDANGNILWELDGKVITPAFGNTPIPYLISDGTGGVIVAISCQGDIFAQRIDAAGNLLWGPGCAAVCIDPDYQNVEHIISDGCGGAIIGWGDRRSGGWVMSDVYAQRVDANGNMLWQSDGFPVCAAANAQWEPFLIGDGTGGALFFWEDDRVGSCTESPCKAVGKDIYAQRMRGNGTPVWAVNGVPVCDADSAQSHIRGVSDGAGGAIIAWHDYRNQEAGDNNCDIYATRIIADEVVTAALDIKPGSCPNPFNPKSQGVTPVALLGSASFDVSSVDPATILLEGVPPLRWSMEDVGTPSRPKDECDCTEAEADGYLDMTLKFKTQELVDALGQLTVGGELMLTITGELTDGTPFEAHDCVVIKGGKKYEEWLKKKRGLACESSPGEAVQLLSYELPERMLVEVSVYDVSGRLVERLEREVREAGLNTIEWNTVGVQSGIYFVKMKVDTWSSTLKVPLVR